VAPTKIEEALNGGQGWQTCVCMCVCVCVWHWLVKGGSLCHRLSGRSRRGDGVGLLSDVLKPPVRPS